MSCRETHGNSAVTSLAKFLTGADETTVSRVFHRVRREGMDAFGEQATTPADQVAVTDLLSAALDSATHDSRIRDSRRPSLKARLESAIADARAGVLPNKATFHAWTELHDQVKAEPETASVQQEPDPTIGITTDGLTISLGDVSALRRTVNEAFMRTSSAPGARSYRDATYTGRRLNAAMALDVTSLLDRAERMEAAYDATDAGFALLSKSAESDSAHPGHREWVQRMDRARVSRTQPNPVVTLRALAELTTPSNAQHARDTALASAREAETQYQQTPSSERKSRLEMATREYRQAQRLWLYTIASDPHVHSAAQADPMAAGTWRSVTGTPSVSRADQWRAIELLNADRDRAEARIGRITDLETARRAVTRAQARQEILDAEGADEVDPVNRRFAESVRLRRRQRARAV
jgi:hypothetical protein